MKKGLLFSCILMASMSVHAQISLSSFNNPSAGTKYGNYVVDSTGVTEGASGNNNVTWDFSTAITDTMQTFNAVVETKTSSTTNASSYPKADVVVNEDTISTFYQSNNDKQIVWGFYTKGSRAVKVALTDSMELFRYPVAYGYNENDSLKGTTTVNYSGIVLNLALKGKVTVTADGEGKLKLPGGTTIDALRVKIVQNTTSTGKFITADITANLDITEYRWYKAGTSYPVMRITYSKISGDVGNQDIKAVILTGPALPTGFSGSNYKTIPVNIFPNPAKGRMNVEYSLTTPNTVKVTVKDLNGGVVKVLDSASKPSGKVADSYEISGLQQGIYIVEVDAGGEKAFGKMVVE